MSNSPFAKFKKAPSIRPMWNIGALFDIQTGKYYKGKHGESILCGGLNHFTGVAGLPNMFKTVISLFQLGSVMNRVSLAIMMAHDSENTLSPGRITNVFRQFPELFGRDLIDDERLLFTDANTYTGNGWWSAMRDYAEDRRNNKDILITTPFVDDNTGELIKIPSPTLVFLDSLSGLQTEGVMDMYDKGSVGGKELNMVAMKGAGAKSQLIDQVTGVTGGSGVHFLMTAHVGQEYQLDMYKPNVKKLKFLKGDLKLKKVPENFSFLTANCWYCVALVPLLDGDKLPEFPRDEEDDLKGDTDLICITLVNLRGKSGPSGIPFEVVVSQSEGLKPELTEFLYCKGYDYFGISDKDGNKAKGKPNFRLDLYPNVNMTRKSIRGLMEDDPRMSRAMNITGELCMMRNLWHDELPDELRCTPKELYADIKALGYDWDLLLDTRGFWLPVEEQGTYVDIPFLSTMDLLNMRAGTYRPYWYDAAAKAKGIATAAVATAKGDAAAPAEPAVKKKPTGADLLKEIAARQEAKVS
ncbi:hypothetical protein D3C76_36690 [compost metagenome]